MAADRAIRQFWRWFESIAAELAEDFENSRLHVELDTRVARLGDLRWELGPGLERPNALVITPDGSKQLLATTGAIVAVAPEIADWEFHWARPPKQWTLEFTLDGRDVDARVWRYVLREFPDGAFGIIIEQNNVGDLDDGERYMAATIYLDGVLGEYRRLTLIDDIELVARLPDDLVDRATPAIHLADHLASIAGYAS